MEDEVILQCEDCGESNNDLNCYDECDGQIFGTYCTDCYLAQWNGLPESVKQRSIMQETTGKI